MDYSYEKEKPEVINFNIERAIFDMKNTLNQVVKNLEDLNNKIENVAHFCLWSLVILNLPVEYSELLKLRVDMEPGV
jgi:hypothetical protein